MFIQLVFFCKERKVQNRVMKSKVVPHVDNVALCVQSSLSKVKGCLFEVADLHCRQGIVRVLQFLPFGIGQCPLKNLWLMS